MTLSDILAEWPIDESPFFGGRGLVNTEGVKKASYFAFMFLSRLGSEIIEQGNYYIITRDGSDLKILLYNYSYLNKSYQNGDQSIIDEENRYSVFEKKRDISISLNITNLTGKYKITHYILGKESGSAFDEWVKMGSPHQLNIEEVKYLKHKSYPEMKIDYMEISDSLKLSLRKYQFETSSKPSGK